MAEVKITNCAAGEGSGSRFDYGQFQLVEVEIEICGLRYYFSANMDEMDPGAPVMVGINKYDDEGKMIHEPVWYEEVARPEQ